MLNFLESIWNKLLGNVPHYHYFVVFKTAAIETNSTITVAQLITNRLHIEVIECILANEIKVNDVILVNYILLRKEWVAKPTSVPVPGELAEEDYSQSI